MRVDGPETSTASADSVCEPPRSLAPGRTAVADPRASHQRERYSLRTQGLQHRGFGARFCRRPRGDILCVETAGARVRTLAPAGGRAHPLQRSFQRKPRRRNGLVGEEQVGVHVEAPRSVAPRGRLVGSGRRRSKGDHVGPESRSQRRQASYSRSENPASRAKPCRLESSLARRRNVRALMRARTRPRHMILLSCRGFSGPDTWSAPTIRVGMANRRRGNYEVWARGESPG